MVGSPKQVTLRLRILLDRDPEAVRDRSGVVAEGRQAEAMDGQQLQREDGPQLVEVDDSRDARQRPIPERSSGSSTSSAIR